MRQVLQDLGTGNTLLVEAPVPSLKKGSLLIKTSETLISVGTEKMLVNFGKASYIEKAKQQPEKVKMVLDKVKTDGLLTTVDAVRSKLAQPLPLGYCNVGTVAGVGAGVSGFSIGDRVVSNGPHADVVRVPKNLCAKIPDAVDDESASFVVVASIGLQGIRLTSPTLGESFVVTGAGLIGLLTVQLLRAHGCRVLAIDFDESKLELARQFGAETCNPSKGEDPVSFGNAFSRGQGVDGVIITASTKSSDPVSQAAQMCRKRGRIVLVGVTGLELNRGDFYEKELSFQVSCSYGPGRYDPSYEEGGNDYPLGFVRWTEQRNFEAVLDMLASGQLDVKPLVSHRFEFENAIGAYNTLTEDSGALGILLSYKSDSVERFVDKVQLASNVKALQSEVNLSFVGAGNYASRVLIPAFKKANARLKSIATSTGITASIHGGKAGFETATTNTDELLSDPAVNAVAVVTQHNSHANFVIKALNSGKSIFVEKPLAIDFEQLNAIKDCYSALAGEKPVLMVGFNRRFAPQVQKMKTLLQPVAAPKTFMMTMNAGSIPADHWTQDISVGGGRIIGEACHYIDLMRYLAGSKIISIQARRMNSINSADVNEDKAAIILGFEDGSFGTIHYLANGASSFPKERIEVFAEGQILALENFRKLKGYGWKGFSKMNLLRQNKGQVECAGKFLEAVAGKIEAPIPVEELFEVAAATLEAVQQLRSQV